MFNEHKECMKNPHVFFLSSQYNKENARLFSRNPFVLRDQEWKDNRGDISPAFTTAKVLIIEHFF